MLNDGSEGIPISAGFSAQVNGASVADLVQMYCQTRQRAAVEIRSGLHIGYLFFDEGRLIHAEIGTLTGEAAFETILTLSAGAFRPTLRPWPTLESIQCSVEALLLRAAQALDESRRRVPSKTPPLDGSVKVSVTRTVGASQPAATEGDHVVASTRDNPGHLRSQVASGVRLDPTGVIVSQRGGKAEGLADLVAFAAPLLDVIGHELGVGETRGADFYCGGGREVLLRREPDGSWVGAVGSARELVELRARLGAG